MSAITDNTEASAKKQEGETAPETPATNGKPAGKGKGKAPAAPKAPKEPKDPAAPKTPRAPRPAAAPTSLIPLHPPISEGEETTKTYKELTFDPAYQMRKNLYDEKTVETYAELKKEGVVFPALWAFDTGVKIVVFSGFNRGEADKRVGPANRPIPVIIWKGTERDAKFWSLRQNSDASLARSPGDVKRAINTLLDDVEMLADVIAKGTGGAVRSVAAAIGCSTGTIGKAMQERGIGFSKSGKVVKVEPKEPKTPKTEPGTTPTTPTVVDAQTQQQQQDAQIKGATNLAVVKASSFQVAKIARFVEEMLTRKLTADTLADRLAANGITVETDAEFPDKRTVPFFTRLTTALEEVYMIVEKAEKDKAQSDAAEASFKDKDATPAIPGTEPAATPETTPAA